MRVGMNPYVNGTVNFHGVGLCIHVRELELKSLPLPYLCIELVLYTKTHRSSHDGSKCKIRSYPSLLQ